MAWIPPTNFLYILDIPYVTIRADSICVHEDNPAARQILKTVRRALDGADVRISPLREVLSL
ncbi:hypothetical protein SMC6_05700 [Candidatus Cryosericum odellii]|uniref:Uncharacterized protein n=1 Tax=Candidatus Cryosericum odellii TaxID=2290917 RepID=A0A398CY54_9BACT|nr:hypothetical protein SMC6_05700 [Candidatus Cryosericum odellii]